jgi:hypothetical protein
MFRGLKCTAGHAQGLSPTNAVHLLRAVRARLAKTRRREHRSPAAFLFGALSGVLRAMQGGAPAVLPWPGGGGGAPGGGGGGGGGGKSGGQRMTTAEAQMEALREQIRRLGAAPDV